VLIGKNVSLRPITLADQKLRLDWFNEPDFMGPYDNHWTSSLEQMEKGYLEAVHHGDALYMITSRDQGEPMGEVGYLDRYSSPHFQGHEIFYVIHPRYRGRGIATQAACVLVNHLFDATPLNRIQAMVVAGNEPSCRVLENAGLTHEGILRGLLFIHGRYVDLHMYSIVRTDWGDEQMYRKARREF